MCGALPRELASLGHDVKLVLPLFRSARTSGVELLPTDLSFSIPIGSKLVEGKFFKANLPDTDATILLLDQPEYYDRRELYRENGSDYEDNCERFVFFCRCVMELIRTYDKKVDIIHGNDWQCGMLPALLEIEYRHVPKYQDIRSLFTIHNLAYQGQFWHFDMAITGLDWKYFNWQQMEYYNKLNLMKTGLIFANHLSTVSSRYAEEIQTPEFGCGMDGVLAERSGRLSGIINGIDETEWNPETDKYIPQTYSVASWQTGKPVCKSVLQKQFNLPVRDDVPVIGMVGRLADQKGWNLIVELIDSWLQTQDVQWAILGTGEDRFHQAIQELQARAPEKVGARLEFSNKLAHLVEAGADMFLMPSQYEPCGLNQLYSLKYGTVPIVFETGGLADTITHSDRQAVDDGIANGFSFCEYDLESLQAAVRAALSMYRDDRESWKKVVECGMNQDWSWKKSASKYIELYQSLIDSADSAKES